MKWTEKQQEVISRRKRNILVSAAAGSGKTAVLVERIIQRILDEEQKVDIDRILVVTFTNAAASEMRERIADAIEKKLEEEPGNAHLLRQSSLIHNARITTIHSFCKSVIMNYFYKINLEPSFRIGDEGEIRLLKSDVLDRLLEAEYEEGVEAFLSFAERFSSDKKDTPLKEAILRVYEYAMSAPWPKLWLEEAEDAYCLQNKEELLQTDWMKEIGRVLSSEIYGLALLYDEMLAFCRMEGGPYSYEEVLQEEKDRLLSISKSWDFAFLREEINQFTFGKLPSRKKDMEASLAKAVQNMRNDLKKQIKNMQTSWFSQTEEEMLLHMDRAGESAEELVRLVLKFMEQYEAEKRDRNLLDFSDLEHKALSILVEEESGEPSDTAEEYRRFYEEIMIDEYQDSNYVQELILSTISRTKEEIPNMFMVGDVKQSIYGFRLARPDLFMEKYHSYQTGGERDCKIELSQNFRSRSCVLESINQIFYKLMREDLGGIEYNEENALYPGNLYPTEDSAFNKTELLWVEKEEGMEEGLVAKRIQELMDPAAKNQVFDKASGQMRDIRYGDIVILMRSLKGNAERMTQVLKDAGIPAISQSQTGYFSAREIRQLLAYLNIIDNPRQDIPLTSVLKSPIYSFTGEMLAKIRAFKKKGDYYDALRQYAEKGEDAELKEKCASFLQELSFLREQSRYLQMHELLELLLQETSFDKLAAAMPGGSQRLANIRMLYEKALAFEKTSYRGLFQFNRYIEQLQSYEIDYGEALDTEQAEDAVRIYSIHKSKGLEFPVVFLCGCGKGFNKMDLNNKILLHGKFGIGLDDISTEKRSRYKTVLKKAIRLQNEMETMAEELRVLYVAMTRAREKLIMTASVDSKKQGKVYEMLEKEQPEVSFYSRFHAGSYLDWITAAAGTQDSLFEIRKVDASEIVEEAAQKAVDRKILLQRAKNREVLYQEADYEALKERFAREEKQEAKPVIPAKLSVSELKLERIREENEDIWESFGEKKELYVPKFAREEQKEKAGASYGTAMHRILECLPFARIGGKENLQAETEKLLAAGRLSEEELSEISQDSLMGFLESSLFKRMKKADEAGFLKKEQPFVMSMKAREADPSLDSDEPILVQGIMDAYFEEDGAVVLVDYKTDRVSTEKELTDRYRRQMELYAHALEASGKRIKEAILYSFRLKKEIVIQFNMQP